MKDSKFIELLNLYVDHQLSAADAALLEAEIQRDPKRRQVYRQYCQMQKACVLLTDKFRSEAPAADTQVAEAFTSRRRIAPITYIAGFAAMAACVALVVVNRAPNSTPNATSAPVAAVQAAQPVAVAAVAKALPERPTLQPVFGGLVHDTTIETTFVSSERAPLDWMTRVQFDRVPVEELRFDANQTVPVDDLMFRNRRVFQTQTEGAAFRFQK